jgi:Rrf2 family protein
MLSQRAKYALRAMVGLASNGKRAPVSVTALARDAKIPRAFLEQIFSELRRHNLVVSHRGSQGGFMLARDPRDISFAEIIRYVDGPLALAPCASRTAFRPCPECRSIETCELRPTLILARDATAAVLEHMTLAKATSSQRASKPRPRRISK